MFDVVSDQQIGEGLPSSKAGHDGVVVGAGGVGDGGEGEALDSQGVEDELAGDADGQEAGGTDEDLGWDAVGKEKGTESIAAQGEAGLEAGVVGLVGEGAAEGSQVPGREGRGSAEVQEALVVKEGRGSGDDVGGQGDGAAAEAGGVAGAAGSTGFRCGHGFSFVDWAASAARALLITPTHFS